MRHLRSVHGPCVIATGPNKAQLQESRSQHSSSQPSGSFVTVHLGVAQSVCQRTFVLVVHAGMVESNAQP